MLKDKEYNVILHCPTCGDDSNFETNEVDGSVVCKTCNSHFPGGKDELLEYNSDSIEEVKEQIAKDAKAEIEKQLKDAFKGIKGIKFKL